jgi:hypothetical protein
MGKTVFPAKGRCHVMRSCHVVENSIGGSLPPRMRGPRNAAAPPTQMEKSQQFWTLHADEDRGTLKGAASDSSMPTTIVDPTVKPTAQELLPRLIGFPGFPLETRALLLDMWQLFLAVQLIPFPRLHLHVKSKAHSPPLGSWDEQDGGPWTVDRGPWMRG